MEILNQFGVKPILLLAQIVNFAILLFILSKFAYKPILKVLEERKQRIEQSLKNAVEIEARLARLAEEEEKVLAKAAEQGEKILKQVSEQVSQILEDAGQKRDQILNQASEDAKRLYVTEKDKLMIEMREHASDLVLSVLQKVTGKIFSKKDQKDMIEKEVRGLS